MSLVSTLFRLRRRAILKSSLRAAVALAATLAIAGCDKSLPRHKLREIEPEAALRLKRECAIEGKKKLDEWKTRYEREIFTANNDFGYSRSLETCLWAGEYIDGSSIVDESVHLRRTRVVVDCLTDRVLLEYTVYNNEPASRYKSDEVVCHTEAEFEKRKDALFGYSQ